MKSKTVEELASEFSTYTMERYGFIEGFSAKERIIKQKLKDSYNKYNSWLQQETQFKIGKGNPNLIRETELRAKVELLKELIEKL